MNYFYYFLFSSLLFSCSSENTESGLLSLQNNKDYNSIEISDDSLKIIKFYEENKGNNLKSEMIGTVQGGSLINGKLIPFYGSNFQYFDVNIVILAQEHSRVM